MKLFILFTSLLALLGCNKELARPETVDPVYIDLKSRLEKQTQEVLKIQKDVEKSKSDFENAPIRSGLRESAQENYFEIQKTLEAALEKHRYLTLKLKSYEKFARIHYKQRFQEHLTWPDPETYAQYKEETKLLEAPKEWNVEKRIKRAAASSVSDSKND